MLYSENISEMSLFAAEDPIRLGLSNTAPTLPIGPNCQASPETTTFKPPNGRLQMSLSTLRSDHVLFSRMCLVVLSLISAKISIPAVLNSSIKINRRA